MEKAKEAPFKFSLLLIGLLVLVNRIPLSEIFISYDLELFYADNLENIILYSLLVCAIFWLIRKLHIPFSLTDTLGKNSIYYIPVIIYVAIFSNWFSDFFGLDFSVISNSKLLVYGAETLSSAFLEEFVFRGLILGLFLYKYQFSKQSILKSALLSSFLFGFMHIINIWTKADQMHVQAVINQMYAAACLGVLYCAVYLKTRNLLMVGAVHFLTNFFAGVGELETITYVVSAVPENKTMLGTMFSVLFTFIIFGLPFFIGLFILQKTNEEEVNKLLPADARQTVAV